MEDSRKLDDFLSQVEELQQKLKNTQAKELVDNLTFHVVRMSERMMDKESIEKVLQRHAKFAKILDKREPKAGAITSLRPSNYPESFLDALELATDSKGQAEWRVKRGKEISIGKHKYAEGQVLPATENARVSWERIVQRFAVSNDDIKKQMLKALLSNSKSLLQGHVAEFTKNTVKDASTALAVMKAVPFVEKEFGNFPVYKSIKEVPLPYILSAVSISQQLLQSGIKDGIKEVGRRGIEFGAHLASKEILKKANVPKQYEVPVKLALRVGSRGIGNWLGHFIFGASVTNHDLLGILQNMSPKERKAVIPVLNEAFSVLPVQAKL